MNELNEIHHDIYKKYRHPIRQEKTIDERKKEIELAKQLYGTPLPKIGV